MKRLGLLLFVFAWSSSTSGDSRAAHDPPLEPGTRIMRAVLELDVPIESAWDAFTTEAGLRAWAAPNVSVDFTVGGLIRSSYNPAADLDGPESIHQRVLAYEPMRLLSMRTIKAPAGFPHARAITNTWGVTRFEALSPGRTRVTFASMGWDEGPEWDDAWTFFEQGNAMVFERLREVLAEHREALDRETIPSARVIEHNATIRARIAEVWKLCTTEEGLATWLAPDARVDLRLGGAIRANTQPDENEALDTITLRILTLEPERFLALRFDTPPDPNPAQPGTIRWWSIDLTPMTDELTHVRIAMPGFEWNQEREQTTALFQNTADRLLAALAERFRSRAPEARIHPVLRELHRLVGGEWIHETILPGGGEFLSRNLMQFGPDGRSLITTGWLGNAAGLAPHGSTQIWRDPVSNTIWFQTINEVGGIARGEITLDGTTDTLHWDWKQTNPDASMSHFLILMRFIDDQTYDMTITRPRSRPQPPADEQTDEPRVIRFTRVPVAPARFLNIRPLPTE